ncbi:MAG: MMPL family transporter [Deltaproteobacteria bacterium]|nr:MMPL family transporter [Deltaproteobacteria bacterium]
MDKHLKTLIDWIIRFRHILIVFFICITLIMIYLAKDLKIDNDYEKWLPVNDKVGDLLRKCNKEFSSAGLMFVVLEFPENSVFHPVSLDLVKRLTTELEGVEELYQITSLTNVMDIRKIDDGIEVSELMPEIPATHQEMDAFREYVLSKEMYLGSLVTADARYCLIAMNIENGNDGFKSCGKIIDTVKGVVGDSLYYVGGDVVIAYYLDHYMTQDLMVLTPIIIIGMIFVLAFGLRQSAGVVLSLIVVFLAIIWTVGLKTVLGYPFNMLSPAVVVLLIAVGSDYAVHMYNHYLKKGDARVSASEIIMPVMMSAMTTIAGLLTFSVTKIEVLRNFGIELAFGLGAACILSIMLVTIGIFMIKTRPEPRTLGAQAKQHALTSAMSYLGGWVHDHTRIILGVALILLFVMGLGISRISTKVDFVEMLPEDSPPRYSSVILEDNFNGMYRVSMYFDGDIQDPKTMSKMQYIENFMRSDELIDGFTSINGLIAEENWQLNNIYAIPETRQGIANLWFMLEGQDLLKTFVTQDRSQAMVNAILKKHDTGFMKQVSSRMNTFLSQHTSDRVISLDPSTLSSAGQRAVHEIVLSNACRQLTWLAHFYDRSTLYDPLMFVESLRKGVVDVERAVGFESVQDELRTYLNDETVEVLTPEIISTIVDYTGEQWLQRHDKGFRDYLTGIVAVSGIMDEEDAALTIAGMIKRLDSTVRLKKVHALRVSFHGNISESLRQNKDFLKRSDGVVWSVLAERPSLFYHEVKDIAGIESAIVENTQIDIEQTGAHQMFSRFDKLLYESQVQSLILASIIVLVMISLTQRSFKRGLISLIAVLVPLEFILGFMGWAGIPLDFGTVLCSALIIGLGVDGSIHFLHYYHRIHKQGLRGRVSLQETIGHVGRAVITANATSCLGFIVLLFSKTSELRNFALINGLAITMVTISVLTLLPSLASLIRLDEEPWRIQLGINDQLIYEEIERRY